MQYVSHLSKDKKLSVIIREPFFELDFHANIPLRLIASIMSQQLNTKVAQIIYNRFLDLYNGKDPGLKQILKTSYEELRGIGLSHAKATYVHAVARFCLEQKITDTMLLNMDDDQIRTLLTQIKGVGNWTVEMLLMFTLGRQDIFPIDDLGIQNAMIKLYGIKTPDKKQLKEKLIKISEKWSPYRTYACMHLWAWKDGK